MIKGFIFDLDGVICSTDEFHYEAWKAIADKEGIYFDKEINNQLRGVSRLDSLDIILRKANRIYSKEEKEKLATEKNDIYRQKLCSITPAYLDKKTLETLLNIKRSGYKIAIGSSSKNTKLILEKLDIINLFDAIVDGNDIKKSKPDPEVFLLAAQKLNLKPNECYVIEDAIPGIQAGHDGGFKTIAFGDAHNSPLKTYSIDNFDELNNFIEK